MTTCYGILRDGQITHTAWTQENLLNKAGCLSPSEIVEINVPPIIEAINWYFEKRGLLYAQDPIDAFLFLMSEIGEVADAIVHTRGAWVRNNERERDFGPEIGDSLMMLCVTAQQRGVDPLDEMLKKFAKKGFPIHE